jgi:hypothetical protein
VAPVSLQPTWPTLAAFLADDPHRMPGSVTGCGVNHVLLVAEALRGCAGDRRFTVAWIPATGEAYAAPAYVPLPGDHDPVAGPCPARTGPILILGTAPTIELLCDAIGDLEALEEQPHGLDLIAGRLADRREAFARWADAGLGLLCRLGAQAPPDQAAGGQ